MTLKQKIFKALDETSYLSDTMVAKIWGGEPNWTTAEEYKRQWRKLKADREFFKDIKILSLEKGRRCYLAEYEKGKYYKIGKDYYEEITPPKLTPKENYQPNRT